MPKKSRWWGREEANELVPEVEVEQAESEEPSEPAANSAGAGLAEEDLAVRERRAEELAASLEGEAQHTREARTRALQQIEKLRADEAAALERAEREEREAERAAAERAQAEQVAHDLAQDEASATERAGTERAAAEAAARRRAEAERVAQEHAEIERKARERAAQEQATAEEAAQRRSAAERAVAEIAEGERTTAKRAMELRELAQEAIEQRHAAEAALDELRARERATRARIAAERASAAQLAAQRALSAQTALERAQAELAAAERAAAERAQLAHSIAERAAQAVAISERAQRELGRAERSLADLEGGGSEAQPAEEDADSDPDPATDPASVASAAEPIGAESTPSPVAFVEDDSVSDATVTPAPRADFSIVDESFADDYTMPAALAADAESPARERARRSIHLGQSGRRTVGRNRWLGAVLFPVGLGAGFAGLWALDRIGDEKPPTRELAQPTVEVAATGEAAAATNLLQSAPDETATPSVDSAPATPTDPNAVAQPAIDDNPRRETAQPAWIRNAAATAPWDGRPMIALVLEGIDGAPPSPAALDLPAPLTFTYLAESELALDRSRRARREGHEVLGVLPTASSSSAQRALDLELDTPELKRRLGRSLDRMDGFIGVRLPGASGLSGDVPRLRVVLRELARRGLLLVDVEGRDNATGGLAREIETPFLVRDLRLRADATAQELTQQLAGLELVARERGTAIAFAATSPAILSGLERWLPAAASRGFRLVPLSAVVRQRSEPAR
jgi:polysaccharide deacetylase 2 family uncharacterized protein YibQ